MNFCKAHVSYPFSIFIEMEINIVGKDDMIKTFLITIELFLVFFSAVKVSIVDVLSFYIKTGVLVFLEEMMKSGAPQSILAGSFVTTRLSSISLSNC